MIRLHQLNEEQVDTILTDITANAIWLEPEVTSRRGAPDPGDNHLRELHQQRPDAMLVTGDGLLLESGEAHGLVVSPSDFRAVAVR